MKFLTTHRASDDFTGHRSPMPALGGASAEPLRYLDFLIRDPVRTVMLHKSGVSITVPAPERYAVHKCIIATMRREGEGGALKRDKDIRQAGSLIEVLTSTRRHLKLSEAWKEAWARGGAWREALKAGRAMLSQAANAALAKALGE